MSAVLEVEEAPIFVYAWRAGGASSDADRPYAHWEPTTERRLPVFDVDGGVVLTQVAFWQGRDFHARGDLHLHAFQIVAVAESHYSSALAEVYLRGQAVGHSTPALVWCDAGKLAAAWKTALRAHGAALFAEKK